MNTSTVELPQGAIHFNDHYVVRDALTGKPLDKTRYVLARANGAAPRPSPDRTAPCRCSRT